MPTPSIQTLTTDAQQVLNLDSISAVRSVVAVALANANTGTPLNPNLTTQQLWDQFYQVVTKPKSDIESIIANQLMKFLFAPPAPGGVGADKQVIFNDGGVLAGDADFLWNKTTNLLTVTGAATITGDLTVDTNTLKVDSANNRVGIGTASPYSTAESLNARTTALTSIAAFQTMPLTVTDSTAYATGVGGGINFRAKLDPTTYQNYAAIWSYRESAINSDYRGSLIIGTSDNSNGYPIERYRIASDGVATWSNVGGVAGTAMTLNSTGLGVGTSPATKLDVNGGTGGAGGQNHATFSGNAGRGLVIGTRSDSVSNDRTATLNAPFTGGSIVLQTQGTDRLLVDSSGNVGIGVTPSAWGGSYKALQMLSLAFSSDANSFYQSNNAFINSTPAWTYIASKRALRYNQDAAGGTHEWYNAPSGTAGNPITWTQAMTLDASGNLLVGKTATNLQVVGCELKANGTVFSTLVDTTNAAASSYQLYSTGAATYRFYVGMGGTVFATNTTISGISDARLKENVQDIDVGLGAILALKPRKFDWKAGKGKDIKGDRGFIAQEFEEVFPNLIDEWKDAAPEGETPYKSVRQDLIPVLVKAIQELTARVQTLETR